MTLFWEGISQTFFSPQNSSFLFLLWDKTDFKTSYKVENPVFALSEQS